jgi:hypothetical protein
MSIVIVKKNNEHKTQFFLNYLSLDGYEAVIDILTNQLKASFIEDVDCIWFYGKKYIYNEKIFTWFIDDDEFCWFAPETDCNIDRCNWLENIVEYVASKINKKENFETK